ncbi:MAG: anti-phage-associated DUF1156 domain-containing protein [Candidatus Binatia bacterium]|nr:anti-phage-associated DUF1156 domain-containing protein [Candidatus Binatia bacterium]
MCFIETQFPVSKISIESYTERKANYSQTLTGMGKWWGRKPLVLCRAAILGLLLPATDNPQKDREIFLRLMTMDDNGMLRRKSAKIPAKEMFSHLPPADRVRYFESGATAQKAKLKRGISPGEKEELQKRVFLSLSYDERLEYCDRPEQIDGPSTESWKVINEHLKTTASSIPELVAELGKRRFGHVPRVGDAFCGGGSIPFEAARLGYEAYGSDLNPVAALLTWASLNIVGGGAKVAQQIRQAQDEIYSAADKQITEWAIEQNDKGWRGDIFLYCNETRCPECGWFVPLAPSWVIAERIRCVAKLKPDPAYKRFNILIESNVSDSEFSAASVGTIKESALCCPNCPQSTPIRAVRGDRENAYGLRQWVNDDLVPRPDDVFQERLYCIRWVETYEDSRGETKTRKHYAAPSKADFDREAKVLQLIRGRFADWQAKGFLPHRKIESGYNTEQPIRERGWTYWHHLFNPRQLLLYGTYLQLISENNLTELAQVACLLGVGRCTDYSGRLCKWAPQIGYELTTNVFANQALNTIWNYPVRGTIATEETFRLRFSASPVYARSVVEPTDARSCGTIADFWLTDPPYADAINYHELSEYFLAWYGGRIPKSFPEWSNDSKRVLAVTGSDENFRRSMVDCYRNLSAHMPDDGLQVVMFTHQDAGVWADLAMILWAAGLRVTSAWCIATETDSALKQGNYVQGTVLLILRKQTSEETAFLDEVYQEVEAEVRRQLDTMRDLDDAKDPNFADTDYQLAAYAAALRVLTAKKIEEIDVTYELTKVRKKGEKSSVEDLIERAVRIACDHLVPKGIDTHLWKSLTAMERLYIKGLELESHGEYRTGVYQELARGFGVEEYKPLLASTKANETRLKTASEFGGKEMSDSGFGATLVRHALFAALKTGETESTRDGITWLTTEVKDYAANRQRLIEILEFLATLRQNASMPHWHKDADAAGLLAGALRNRQDNV